MKKKYKIPSEKEFKRFVEEMSRFETPKERRRRKTRGILLRLLFIALVAAIVYFWWDAVRIGLEKSLEFWRRLFNP